MRGRATCPSGCTNSSTALAFAAFAFGLGFPAFVHPDPLFRVAEDEAFEHVVIGLGIKADGFADVVVLDGGDGVFEAEDV